jgi:ribosomal protein L37E
METIKTSTLKPKTTTVYIGQTDKKEYIICKKCGTFHLRKEKCEGCIQIEKQEKIRKEQVKQEKLKKREKKIAKEAAEKQQRKIIKEQKKNARFLFLWKHYQTLIECMTELINTGFPNEVIMATFFNERNPPYDLSNTKPEYQIKIKPFGDVLEHVNGRETIGYYCVYAILIGDIKDPQELEQFYITYCGQIRTDANFNNKVVKPYQNDKGAISPEMYMELLEKERNYFLTAEEKEYFRSKFLYSKYGKIVKEEVINYLRRHGKKA